MCALARLAAVGPFAAQCDGRHTWTVGVTAMDVRCHPRLIGTPPDCLSLLGQRVGMQVANSLLRNT